MRDKLQADSGDIKEVAKMDVHKQNAMVSSSVCCLSHSKSYVLLTDNYVVDCESQGTQSDREGHESDSFSLRKGMHVVQNSICCCL